MPAQHAPALALAREAGGPGPKARVHCWLLLFALLTACDCDSEPVRPDASMADGPDRTCPPDADGDRIPDEVEGSGDADGDGIPNFEDPDSDGDGILDQEEAGDPSCTTPPIDTDGDGTPDYLDLDSDGDGVDDATEGTGDPDMDGVPSYRDLDSDDDGASDADEDEAGTDRTIADTDGDGFPDLVEIARERIECPGGEGEACDCATDASCGIPEDDYYVVLPMDGSTVSEELLFQTTVPAADVFFLMDTTTSMGTELDRVRATIATPSTGLIARIAETLPTVRFGAGQHEDFPFGGYGASGDAVFRLATALEPADRAAVVGAAVDAMVLHDGGDGPESATEALFHVLTGEGGSWSHTDGGSYSMPRYASDCASGWGAPCFRDDALAVVLHFTDFCSHQGPPSEDRSACPDYAGVAPSVIDWSDLVTTMNDRGAKYVGINTDATACADADSVPRSPCLFMRETAIASGAVDESGAPLVYDLPDGGADESSFADAVVGAIETALARVPLDVDTALRDDPSDAVDATAFVAAREPACLPAMTDDCWIAPDGVDHEDAVGSLEADRFVDVLPGTEVVFRLTFANESVPEERRAQVFVAFVDVRGDGGPVLDTREVYIVVPAQRGAPLL
jgi:hypothetical protein